MASAKLSNCLYIYFCWQGIEGAPWVSILVALSENQMEHDDVIKWKHFPRYWPFVRGSHRSPVNSLHKGQWRGALMFSLICVLNKRLSKQSRGWWFETTTRSLWRHCNVWKQIYLFVLCATCMYVCFIKKQSHQCKYIIIHSIIKINISNTEYNKRLAVYNKLHV